MYQRTPLTNTHHNLGASTENRWDERDVFDADVDKFGRQKTGLCGAVMGLFRAIGLTCWYYLSCGYAGKKFKPPQWVFVTVIAIVSIFLFMGLYDWHFDQSGLQRLYDRDLERMQAQAEYELQWFKNFQKQALDDMRTQHQKDSELEQQWFHDEVAKIAEGHQLEARAHAETKAALEHAHGKHTTAAQITDHLAQKVNEVYTAKSAHIEDINTQVQMCQRERAHLQGLVKQLEETDQDVEKHHMEDYDTHSAYYREGDEGAYYDPYDYEDHGEADYYRPGAGATV